ncbi:divergent protein kinase domain 1C [Lycorma delicatula]|uniref:divergent protein kinase domain 1C n=1 Tax=Lycorma delicatula TaxID=130591 RepID=UPI003F5175EA
MALLRRIPGLLYNHRYALFTFFIIIGFIVYKLLHWRVICTNFEPWRHVKKLCSQYTQNEVSGDLCMPLCIGSTIHSLSCQSFHAGKEVVFSAVHVDKTKLVFKMARQDDSQWLEKLDDKNFPTESEFEKMIQSHVSTRLNLSISLHQSRRFARFISGDKAKQGSEQRKAEVRDLWHLLQDNEYLLATVFVDKDVFPKVLGSCGQYFAVEYLKPAMEGGTSNNLFENEGKENWSSRVHLANLILDLLAELDLSVKGGFSLCDIKPSHFGISTRSGKLKFLDLDVTLPKSIADMMVANNAPCHADNECDLFDCKSKCNYISGKCDKGVLNNNLQVICEKIFLGWKISSKLITPGLLMSQHTPPQLASLLRQCADPDIDGDTPISVKDRLSTTLSEIDRLLAASGYDYDNNIF